MSEAGGASHCNMNILGVLSIGLLVLGNCAEARVSKRSSHREDRMGDFDIGDLVSDLSSIPGYGQARADTRDIKINSDEDPEEEEEEEDYVEVSSNATGRFSAGKRSDGDFNVGDIIDWSAVPGVTSAAITEGDEAMDQDDVPGDHLNPNDFKAADIVSDMGYDFEMEDPILSANLFEGDIANVNLDALQAAVNSPSGRNAIRNVGEYLTILPQNDL